MSSTFKSDCWGPIAAMERVPLASSTRLQQNIDRRNETDNMHWPKSTETLIFFGLNKQGLQKATRPNSREAWNKTHATVCGAEASRKPCQFFGRLTLLDYPRLEVLLGPASILDGLLLWLGPDTLDSERHNPNRNNCWILAVSIRIQLLMIFKRWQYRSNLLFVIKKSAPMLKITNPKRELLGLRVLNSLASSLPLSSGSVQCRFEREETVFAGPLHLRIPDLRVGLMIGPASIWIPYPKLTPTFFSPCDSQPLLLGGPHRSTNKFRMDRNLSHGSLPARAAPGSASWISDSSSLFQWIKTNLKTPHLLAWTSAWACHSCQRITQRRRHAHREVTGYVICPSWLISVCTRVVLCMIAYLCLFVYWLIYCTQMYLYIYMYCIV